MMQIVRSGGLSVRILLSLQVPLIHFIEAAPIFHVQFLWALLEQFVEVGDGRAMIAQFSFIPLNALVPSVVTLHEYLKHGLEEHCRLMCRWQIKLKK